MNNPTSKFYPDVVIQALVILPMLFCYLLAITDVVFLIGALLIQIAVGAVQVLSGLCYMFTRESSWHRNYFFAACGYLIFLWILMGSVESSKSFPIFFTVFSGIIPVGIALWYVVKSLQYHKSYEKPTGVTPFGDEELLDDVFQVVE